METLVVVFSLAVVAEQYKQCVERELQQWEHEQQQCEQQQLRASFGEFRYIDIY